MPQLTVGLDLLDREVIGVDDELIGKVDDVELSDPAEGPPTIVALLLGPAAYGRRIGGRMGRWIERSGMKMAEIEDPIRVPMTMVAEIDVSVRLAVTYESLQRPRRLDDWLGEHFINRIPGAHRARE